MFSFGDDANSIFSRSVGTTLGQNVVTATPSLSLSDRIQNAMVSRMTQLAGGNRRRAKYGLFTTLLIFFFLYTWLLQGYETSEHDRVVKSNMSGKSAVTLHAPSMAPTPSSGGTFAPSLSDGGTVPIIYPPSTTPQLTPPSASAPSEPSEGKSEGQGDAPVSFAPTGGIDYIDAGGNSTAAIGDPPSPASTLAPTTGNSDGTVSPSSDSMVSFWLSVIFSFFTWIMIIQIVRYLRRPYRSRANALLASRERGQMELINQLIMFNSSNNPNVQGIATRLRLAMLNRDFTAEDYEMLSQLDEVRNGGTGSALRRRGASQTVINQLPVHKMTQQELDDDAARLEGGINSGGGSCCNICLGPYEVGDEVRTVVCMHKFHKECIDNWLKVNAVCPICKYSVLTEDGAGTIAVPQ